MKIKEIVRKLAEKVFQMGNIEQADATYNNFKKALERIDQNETVHKIFLLSNRNVFEFLDSISNDYLSLIYHNAITFNLFAHIDADNAFSVPVCVSFTVIETEDGDPEYHINMEAISPNPDTPEIDENSYISGSISVDYTHIEIE